MRKERKKNHKLVGSSEKGKKKTWIRAYSCVTQRAKEMILAG